MGVVTHTGYRRDSPDVGNPYNIIPSGRISMRDVDFPVFGIDNKGNSAMMYPEQEYKFAGDYVVEYPIKIKKMEQWANQDGGSGVATAGMWQGIGMASNGLFSAVGNIWASKTEANAQKDIAHGWQTTNLTIADKTNATDVQIGAGHDIAAEKVAMINAQAAKYNKQPLVSSDTLVMGAAGLVMVIAVIGLFKYANK